MTTRTFCYTIRAGAKAPAAHATGTEQDHDDKRFGAGAQVERICRASTPNATVAILPVASTEQQDDLPVMTDTAIDEG